MMPRPSHLVAAARRLCVALALALAAQAAVAPIQPALALTKADVFEKCGPATALVALMSRRGVEIGAGVVVDPKGLLVTNYHVVADAPQAETFYVFLYDPKERIVEEDIASYVRAHQARALQPRVLRVDPENDLALLQLPERKGGYPTVPWGDSDAVRIGQDVVAIGNPQGLAWTLTSGSISAIRKNALQTETAINPGNSGGPLLDMEGRLVGINTWIRKNAQSLGFARPSNVVRAFVDHKGDLGHALANGADRPDGKPSPDGAAMGLIVKRVFADVEKRFPGTESRKVVCALFSAFTYGGRTLLSGVGEVAWLNDSLEAAVASLPEADRPKAVKYIEQSFPLLAVSQSGHLWIRSGVRYFDVGKAVAMDIDDATGQIYATDSEGNVMLYERSTGKWLGTRLGPARDIEASDGAVFVLDKGGLVSMVRGEKKLTLSSRPVRGSLFATRGVLYVLDHESGSLFRWRGGQWDNGGEAIASGVHQVQAFGSTWYGLDTDGRVYSGNVSSYIDRDGDLMGIWLMGEDLLGLGRDGLLYLWSNRAKRWRALSSYN
ncbi:MAG: trypsin-like peptidase domain-containing protein [Deltaproteobacteria bacterium]|nr:trypsin-like peptidase domain-containing protein [Deltaproteobacteria bacterium]